MSTQEIETVEATDAKLLEEYTRRRDQAAFRELVERHHSMVLGVARRVVGCSHSAEDVLQATFLVLSKDAHRIRKRESLASWLYGVAYRIAIRAAKQRARTPIATLEDEAMVDASPLERLTKQSEESAALEELHNLPKNMRMPMVMRYIGGKSNSQIADELKLSESAVEGRLKRGRNQLRMRLARLGVSLGAVTTMLATLGRESQAAETSALIAKTVDACCTVGVGAEPQFSNDVMQLANEEIMHMTTFKLSSGVLWSIVTLGVIASGWAIASDGAPTTGQNSPGGAATTDFVVAQVTATPAQTNGIAIGATGKSNAQQSVSKQERLQRLGYYSVDEPTEKSIEVLEALQQTTNFEFSDAPLAEVLRYVGERHSIQVVLDKNALQESGIDASSDFITVDLEDVKLKNALRLTLDEFQLAFVERNEVLVVTTREAAEDAVFTRTYRTPPEWSMETKDIVDTITTNIEPNSWAEVGGPGAITVLGGGIVITNSHYVHDKINELFAQLHRLHETP